MILSLSIRDFVLIDRLNIEPGTGFTALTGETGAGKSIILDALSLAMGQGVDRSMIRAGADQASIAAEFAPEADHPVWQILLEAGLDLPRNETLTLKRVIRVHGPSRAFVNDQPVSAALLAETGESLVEIHGQHAASTLMRPVTHRRLLDQFAGNEALLAACAEAHATLVDARHARQNLESEHESALATRAFLESAVSELDGLAPTPGEAVQLAETRTVLMQSERVSDAVQEAEEALVGADVDEGLARASRAMERICRLPGFESSDGALPIAARVAAEAIERAIIETGEAVASIIAVGQMVEHDGAALESAEARLFALRAAGRKHGVDPDLLPDLLETLRSRLCLAEDGAAALDRGAEG